MAKLNHSLPPGHSTDRYKLYDKRHFRPLARKSRARTCSGTRLLNSGPLAWPLAGADVTPMEVDDPRDIDPYPRPTVVDQPTWHNADPLAYAPLVAELTPVGQPMDNHQHTFLPRYDHPISPHGPFIPPQDHFIPHSRFIPPQDYLTPHGHFTPPFMSIQHADIDVIMLENDYIPCPPIISGYVPIDLPEAIDVDFSGSTFTPDLPYTSLFPPQQPPTHGLPPLFYSIPRRIEDSFFTPNTNVPAGGDTPWLNNGLPLQSQQDVSFGIRGGGGEANQSGGLAQLHTELVGDYEGEEEDDEEDDGTPSVSDPPWADAGDNDEDDDDEVEIII
ncbi:hypothetical protein AX15_005108 [Amanita polypyramis BW_CC]|nr:hypothetical protein AX15_005108 [Amanita polypyramis BW_CC]